MKDEMTVREPASKPVSNYTSQAADVVEEGLTTPIYKLLLKTIDRVLWKK